MRALDQRLQVLNAQLYRTVIDDVLPTFRSTRPSILRVVVSAMEVEVELPMAGGGETLHTLKELDECPPPEGM
eukprot:48763-Eustigmatos_ZCMA.PRE.1